MTNEDYQLEELENAAVNKSNNAKRIVAAAGLAAVGSSAATYAATNIPIDSEDPVVEPLEEEDLDSVKPGPDQVHEPEAKSQTTTTHQPTTNDDDVDVSFDKTTHIYDEDNNLVATVEEGTIDGKQFKLVDVDGDMRADVAGYDADGNGVINEDEVVYLTENEQIAMGHATVQHEDKFIAIHEPNPEPIEPIDPYDPYDPSLEKDYANNTIHNDFEDEKTGESYSHDYADNNDDYNNGDVYSAHSAGGSDYAYEEDAKDESDYEYNDLAENDMTEDSYDDIGSDSLDIV